MPVRLGGIIDYSEGKRNGNQPQSQIVFGERDWMSLAVYSAVVFGDEFANVLGDLEMTLRLSFGGCLGMSLGMSLGDVFGLSWVVSLRDVFGLSLRVFGFLRACFWVGAVSDQTGWAGLSDSASRLVSQAASVGPGLGLSASL